MSVNAQSNVIPPGTPVILDGGGTGAVATVAQFHNTDNQAPASNANGLMTGGVAQIINAAGNLDRQTSAGADQVSNKGIISGAMSFAQEVQATSTTTVNAAAAMAALSVANTAGFKIGAALNFEPGTTKYESAVITAIMANTAITVQFPSGGAVNTHTQPYTVQSFMFNQERDYSGEGPVCSGVGSAIAAEFESNSGGPPLSNSLPSGFTLDNDKNFQGKGVVQTAVTSTLANDTALVFAANPWTSGLVVGQAIILSATQAGAAVEEVVVSKNNTPQTGATLAARTVLLASPVVNAGSTYAQFDAFALNGPANTGASVVGVGEDILYLFNAGAADPKKPLVPLNQAVNSPGAASVRNGGASCSMNIATPTVVKASPGRTVRLNVNTAGSGAGTLNDCATTGAAAAANTIFTIPNTAGTYFLDWQHMTGIVIVPGTGQVLAVCYD